MNEQLKQYIESYKKTDWKVLLQENHGDYHLKEIKPHLDVIKNFIDDLLKNISSLSDAQQNTLNGLFENFENHKNQIINYQGKGQRDTIIHNIVGFKSWMIEYYYKLVVFLDIQNKYSDIDRDLKHGKSDKLFTPTKKEKWLKEWEKSAEEKLNKEMIKVQQLQSQLKERTTQEEASRYGEFFKKCAEKNKKLSVKFQYRFFSICALLALIAYDFLKFDQSIEAKNLIELLIKGDVINKVFILSVALIVISTIRREYLALRHQFTLNEHRSNAINSHKEILKSYTKNNNKI